MRKLILASASPRRRELLAAAGFRFEVRVSAVAENEDPAGDPREMSAGNALAKACAVAAENPDALVLGADTVVALGKRVFNKPADLAEAREMLRALGGNEHEVFTGVAFVCAAAGLPLRSSTRSIWSRTPPSWKHAKRSWKRWAYLTRSAPSASGTTATVSSCLSC